MIASTMEQSKPSERNSFDDLIFQEWIDVINLEQFTNLKQSWEKAIPVTITSVKKRDKDYLVFIRLRNRRPSWVKEGEIVSISRKQKDTKLIEGKILVIEEKEEDSKTRLCMLQIKQRKIEKTMEQEQEQWLLPFSSVPYKLSRENVMRILLNDDTSIAKEVLTREKITSNTVNVIQGSSGMGKTTGIGKLCLELYKRDKKNNKHDITQHSGKNEIPKVLLTAFTHKACFNIAEKLDELKIPFVTINIRGMPDSPREKYDLDYIAEQVTKRARKVKTRNHIINWKRYNKAIQQQLLKQIKFIICPSMEAIKRFVIKNKPIFQLNIVNKEDQMFLPIFAGIFLLAEETIVFSDPIHLPS
ncbi:MAG: hypothetical protein ACFFCQ_12620 [Promethearchaeota archaeon]